MRPGRCGLTLLELVVVLAVVGILAGVAAPVLRRAPAPSAEEAARERVAEVRARAVRGGHSVAALVLDADGEQRPVLARPDGSVLGAEALGIEPLSGRLQVGGSRGR